MSTLAELKECQIDLREKLRKMRMKEPTRPENRVSIICELRRVSRQIRSIESRVLIRT